MEDLIYVKRGSVTEEEFSAADLCVATAPMDMATPHTRLSESHMCDSLYCSLASVSAD